MQINKTGTPLSWLLSILSSFIVTSTALLIQLQNSLLPILETQIEDHKNYNTKGYE